MADIHHESQASYGDRKITLRCGRYILGEVLPDGTERTIGYYDYSETQDRQSGVNCQGILVSWPKEAVDA